MQFKIDPRIFKDFPDLTIGIVVAHAIDNTQTNQEIVALLKKQQEQIAQKLKVEQLAQHPHIAPWRQAYKQFGAKPQEYLSSIENMVRRVLKGQEIKSASPLVDLYNSISLKYLLPAGGEDLDKIQGDIVLTIAGEHEKPVQAFGEPQPRAPLPGEVIYKDDEATICRRWNWRGTERTKITQATHNAILVIERLAPVKNELLQAAIYELAALIERYCGGTATVAFLDSHHQFVTLKKDGTYISLETKKHIDHVESPLEIMESKQAQEPSGEYKVRIEKVERMRAMGIEPWPEMEPVTDTAAQVVQEFKEGERQSYTLAGRIMVIRLHGKTAFADLQDYTGKIQIYIKADDVGADNFAFFKEFIDSGDILWCTGYSFKTKAGEISIHVEQFKLLSKSLHPLPEKFHGLTDIETRHRQRYLDLITNSETRERFFTRSAIIKQMRCYLDENRYMEVETPMLHLIPGGAAARPFVTHHNALNIDLYLRIAPELYLKRLVVGGFERVYEINRNFRNEGISTRHNPEFTMLEFYTAHENYIYAMDFIEKMFRKVLEHIGKSLVVPFGNYSLDFSKPFKRINARQALLESEKVTALDLAPESLDATCKRFNIVTTDSSSADEKIFALFEKLAEPQLIQPTFIIDFPIEISPLAKRDPKMPWFAARFELFIAGMEIANGFNELNDPFDQAERFKEQVKALKAGQEEAMRYDAEYITALEYGLPPAVGVGIGIDRLVMLLTNTTSIKEVILFPTLKKRESE